MPEGLQVPFGCQKVSGFPSECRKVSGFPSECRKVSGFPSGCGKVCRFPSGCRKVCEFPYLKFLVGSIRFVGRLTCHAKQYYELLYLFQVVLPCCLHLVMKTLFQSYLYLQYT